MTMPIPAKRRRMSYATYDSVVLMDALGTQRGKTREPVKLA